MNYSTTNTPGDDTSLGSAQQAPDIWSQKWTLEALSESLAELRVNDLPPKFELERQPGTQPAVYALKPVTPIELPKAFAPSLLLTELGKHAPSLLKCKTPLCSSFAEPHDPYWDALEEVIDDQRDLKRLEGTIEMSDGPHTLRLYQLNVLTDGKTLLLLDISNGERAPGARKTLANPDGSAIGHN